MITFSFGRWATERPSDLRNILRLCKPMVAGSLQRLKVGDR